MAYFACQNPGIFKGNKDNGLTSYRNLRFSTCQNVWVFHKNHVFWRQKPMAYFCLSKSWIFWGVQRFRLTLYQNSRFNTCRNHGVFHKNQFFDVKNPWPILLVTFLGFLKRKEILGLHCIKMSGKTAVKIFGIS